jgi:hypothetical protein
MNQIKKIVVGSTTEAAVRLLFDNKVLQASNDGGTLTLVARALKINDLRTQVLSYIKRNPNSRFEIIAPEHSVDKSIGLVFNNFVDSGDDDDVSEYRIVIDDSFTSCEITQKAKIGADITMTLKAR